MKENELSDLSAGFQLLSDKMDAWRDEISEWQRNLKVVNNLQEVDSGIKVLNKLQDTADF